MKDTMRVLASWFAAGMLTVLVAATPAWAQDSRAGAIAAEQAEKAKHLTPPKPSKVEEVVIRLTEGVLQTPNGFYPYFDSVYSGGGFTLGAGYRHYVGDRTTWYTQGLYSLSSYKLIETGVNAPGLAGGRLGYRLKAGWRDATQVGYYGLGMDTSPDDRANFRFNETFAGIEATYRPSTWTVLTGGVGYDAYDTKTGEGNKPSIEEIYTGVTAPGLGADPDYLRLVGSAGIDLRPTSGIDYRPAAGYARTGGYYGVKYQNYMDQDDTYSFDQIDLDLIQHVPIQNETWVLSFHGRVQTVLDDDDVAPYFLLPSLGSGSTLRAYPSWRFRDRHSLLLQGEFRWIPNRTGLDMAIFYDTGKVAGRRGDLDDLDDLKSNVGIGARFHGPAATPLRIELAKGSEGWNLVFAGSAAF